jgi:hypothetical protein
MAWATAAGSQNSPHTTKETHWSSSSPLSSIISRPRETSDLQTLENPNQQNPNTQQVVNMETCRWSHPCRSVFYFLAKFHQVERYKWPVPHPLLNQMDFQWQIHHILNHLIQGFARFGNCKGVDFITSQVAFICCQSNRCWQQIASHPPPLPSFLFFSKLCRWLNFILCNVTLHLNASHIALCHLNFSFCCCESPQIFIHLFIKNYHFS